MVESDTLTSTDIALLPSLSLTERSQLPEITAVYFALSITGEVLYVGKANNLRSRWYGHHRYDQLRKFRTVRLAWFETPQDELDATERAFIAYYDPPLNNSNLWESSDRTIRQPHCAACRRIGRIPPFDLFVCEAHGYSKIVMRGPNTDAAREEHRLTYGRDHRLVIRLESIEELELDPYDEMKGEHYEPFEEPA